MPGHLPKMAFIRRIKPFQMIFLFFFLFIKSQYSTKLCQLMSMNGGQTLHLSGFQHTFILRVMPGHSSKKEFSGKIMQFELSNTLFKQ